MANHLKKVRSANDSGRNNTQKKIPQQSNNSISYTTDAVPMQSDLWMLLFLFSVPLSLYFLSKTIDSKDAFWVALSLSPILCTYIELIMSDIKHHTQLKQYLEKHHDATQLDFSNSLDSYFGSWKFVAVCEFLKTNNTLTSISFRSYRMSNNSIKALVEALKTNKTLSFLNLASTKISDEGMVLLIDALKVNNSITHIDLSDIDLHNLGVAPLADLLKTNTNITSVNLSSNKIDNLGAFKIAEALKINTTLKLINLKNNDITTEGILALNEVTKVNKALLIDLSYICIDKDLEGGGEDIMGCF